MKFSGLARTLLGSSALKPLATIGMAALFTCVVSETLQSVVANGDTRTLSFHHIHSDERLTVTFKRDGRYDEGSLKKLNSFLRDWRNDDVTNMDPHLFDLLWEIHRHLRANAPITIISAYRSPQTNAMLRARGRGVARFSQHMSGKAIDFYIPGVELSDIRETGMRLQRGGVGFYPTSGSPFVHIDTGGVRHWPRVSPDHLARIFPDGKTVHIASDGKQMRGFMVAKAEIEARGDRPGAVALASLGESDEEDTPRIAQRPRMASAPVPTTQINSDREQVPSRPMVVASAPSAPALAPTAPAMPVARPSNLGDVTASLPRETEKPREQTQVMAYADPDDRVTTQFGPIPSAHQRLALRYEPEARMTPADPRPQTPPQTPPQAQPQPQPKPQPIETASLEPRIPAAAPASRPAPQQAPVEAASAHQRQVAAYMPYADAARPPARLIHARSVQDTAELYHPDLMSTRSMVEPVRTALRVQFGDASVTAPASVNFSGPAVVALRVVAFDRGGGIMGGLASRTN